MSGLVNTVKQNLLGRIFSGKCPPGSNLREARLAQEFGTSQATVRAALQSLESDGLVVREPDIGTTVIRLTPNDIRERVDLRCLLEVRAALAASKRMGPAEFKELERLRKRMGSFVEKNLYYEEAQADLDFHRYVWTCSANQTLCNLLERLTVPLLAFVSVMRASGLEHLPEVVPSHEPMVQALRSRDAAKIKAAFREGARSTYLDFVNMRGNRAQQAVAFGWLTGHR
ncbi:MAG TPA: GntR family transcriptional regulator [Candidatus Sulfopaludibacter sp.]|jgi:DNA-binding GntR family transcriptional regulator|nr:GntR family transcriptional regulator [Candidatus Sulfopaludibacter sp.]